MFVFYYLSLTNYIYTISDVKLNVESSNYDEIIESGSFGEPALFFLFKVIIYFVIKYGK